MNTQENTPIDLNIWCRYILNAGHVSSVLIILAQFGWLFLASNVIRWPLDVYLRNFIIVPALGLFV